MLIPVFLTLTILLLITTLAPLSRYEYWWIRGWDFPRLQLFIISLLLIGVELYMLDLSLPQNQILIGLGIFCLLYLGWWVLPYTVLFKKEVKQATNTNPSNSLRILVANVLITNKEASTLLHFVAEYDPDIFLTLESDAWWQKQLTTIESDYPYTIKYPQNNGYGMHVYSKYQLLEPEINFLVEDDIPSIRANVLLPSGQEVETHFLHPAPPSPTQHETSEERDTELLIIAKEISEKENPVIVMGDMNDVAWSRTTRLFRKISGLLDPRVGRGMYSSFHAEYTLMRWPLDHLFHSKHFNVLEIKRLPYFGSDHFPILVELAMGHRDENEGEGLNATREDEKEAEEKTKK